MNSTIISKNKNDIDMEKLVSYICQESYWGKKRDRNIIAKSIENSLCYSVLLRGNFIGFARVVTDKATFKYLCDLFILPEYQGKGFGKKLLEYIMADPELKEGGSFLLTRDAHELYRKFGFKYARGNQELINKLMYKEYPKKDD